jgi:uncharacterized membrane protein YGL010W
MNTRRETIVFGSVDVAACIVGVCLLFQRVVVHDTVGIIASAVYLLLAVVVSILYIRWDLKETKKERKP